MVQRRSASETNGFRIFGKVWDVKNFTRLAGVNGCAGQRSRDSENKSESSKRSSGRPRLLIC